MNAKIISIFLLFAHCSMVKNAAGFKLRLALKDNMLRLKEGLKDFPMDDPAWSKDFPMDFPIDFLMDFPMDDPQWMMFKDGPGSSKDGLVVKRTMIQRKTEAEVLQKFLQKKPTLQQIEEVMATDMTKPSCVEFVTNEKGIISVVDTPSANNAYLKMIITDLRKEMPNKITDILSVGLGRNHHPLSARTVPSMKIVAKELLKMLGQQGYTIDQIKEIMATDMTKPVCMKFLTNEKGIIYAKSTKHAEHAFQKMLITDLMKTHSITNIFSIMDGGQVPQLVKQ